MSRWNVESVSPDYTQWTFVSVDISFCAHSVLILDTLPFESDLMLHKEYSIL